MNQQDVKKIAGFLLFMLGFTALILQLVGIQWVFLQFLNLGGALFAFMAKIIMVLAGILLFVFANTDWEAERRDLEK